jgi:membrane protein implicated in regulation of membrane protease activity
MDNEEELRKYFDFDDADLFANRSGYLSPRQENRIKKDLRSSGKFFGILGFIFLGLALIPLIILLINVLLSHETYWYLWLIFTIVGILWIIPSIFFFRVASDRNDQDTLKIVEGKVNTVEEVHDGPHLHKDYDYYWKIGGVRFDVLDPNKVDILEQGDTYRVYYLDLAKAIMSLEKIPNKEGK